jgi:hypothetical protein
MKTTRWAGQESGQSLVYTALAMTVLVLIVALAVDAGHWYFERRRMQNAADAGALAGAWELCFGDPDNWQTTALNYATDPNKNGADPAKTDADPVGSNGVRVTAGEEVDSFFGTIAAKGPVPISAVAEAVCGAATNPCNVYPLTFNLDRWKEIACDEPFYVWNDDKFETTEALCNTCDCTNILTPPDGEDYQIIMPSARGWVNLPRPKPPYTDANKCTDNCGSKQDVCIINNGYLAPIGPIDAEHSVCVAAQPGVANSVRSAIDAHAGAQVNILLWDKGCGDAGECSSGGEGYHVVDTGCVQIISADQKKVKLFPLDGFKNSDCPDSKVVVAKKLCNCTSSCSGTSGELPQPWEVKAVSLTK